MKLRDGFKHTEVGVVPEDWDVVRLATHLKSPPDYGINAPAVPYDDRLPTYIRITDITSGGRFSPDKLASVNAPRAEQFLLHEGDIVFARTGASVGKSYLYDPSDGKLVFAGFLIRVRPNPARLLPAYLASFVTTAPYWNWVRVMSMRSGQPGINGQEFGQLPIPCPPLREQIAIVGALEDVDALLRALETLISKKRDLLWATVPQLVTGKRRLQDFVSSSVGSKQTEAGVLPERWRTATLGELFSFKNGLNKGKEHFGHGTPIVNYMDVYDHPGLRTSDLSGRVSVGKQELKNFEVRKGDVFFTRTSETLEEIGLAAVMLDEPIDTVFSGFVLRARAKTEDLDDEFKRYCFSTSEVRKAIVSKSSYTTRALTNGRLLSAVPIPLPPVAEQRAIATMLSDMDAEIAALEAKLAKTRLLKQGMMQELLTGRTRLV